MENLPSGIDCNLQQPSVPARADDHSVVIEEVHKHHLRHRMEHVSISHAMLPSSLHDFHTGNFSYHDLHQSTAILRLEDGFSLAELQGAAPQNDQPW